MLAARAEPAASVAWVPRAPRWPTAPHGCIHSVFPAGYPASVHHLFKLCDISKEYGIENTFIHCFMDGRDTDPKSGKGFIEQLTAHCEKSAGKIASIVGRFYAMDRDKGR